MGQYVFMMLGTTVLAIIAGIYLYRYIRRSMLFFHIHNKWCIRLISGAITVVMVLNAANMFSIWAAIMFFVIVSCLVTDGIRFLVKRYVKEGIVRRVAKKVYCGGLCAIVLVVVLIIYGYLNMVTIRETDYAITTAKELGQDMLRIVQISDLHLGTTMDSEKLGTILERINELEPDLLVLTGDIFDESTKKDEMEKASSLFGKAEAKDGVYYILGNHDSNQYRTDREYTKEEMTDTLENSGVNVLQDEAELINDSYYIIGRIDASLSTEGNERKTPSQLTEGLDKSKFILLLDHQPLKLAEAADADVDLELSGHTHGGQIWPTGQLSTWFGNNEVNYGKKVIGNYTEIVTSGIGGWGYPLRTGGKSEYVVIDVTTKQ